MAQAHQMTDGDRRIMLLRDTGGGGAPADDPDYTDPANHAAMLALPLPSSPMRQPEQKLIFWVEAYDSDDVLLARGSATLDLVVYRVIGPREIVYVDHTGASNGVPQTTRIVDSEPISTTLCRPTRIDIGQVDRFHVGIQNQANMPATTDRLRIFWRME